MSLRIDVASVRDAATLARLNRYVHELHLAHVPQHFKDPTPDEAMNAFAALLNQTNAGGFIAYEGDMATGYLLAFLHERAAHTFGHALRWVLVDQVSVEPAWKRRGVARALMDAARAWAREVGAHEMELETWAFNTDAQATFQALGFRPKRHRFSLDLRD